ncbi:S9 family peptidase [Pseudidiomarina sp. 1ASP75-14]|uniref:alpha/beta fold hydrolase n=1 Tax=Pseudidiomarina terrestris TaxID=2820060 RepID=UPI00265623FE|nr:alpha/beta fold hydrolase [Pseudidiomarina sp. 1ASP75-14]MDN7136617.1 S9 family peptidase [Pseudidiomarina sp. 1ASP75-14]
MRALALSFVLSLLLVTEVTAQSTASNENFGRAQLSIERIFSAPDLTTVAPANLKFSPDGAHIAYLRASPDQPQVNDLWVYDVRQQEHRLLVASSALVADPTQMSAAERARRERMRIRKSGIVDYQWSPSGEQLLIPIAGQLYLVTPAAAAAEQSAELQVQQLTRETMNATDARFSPQGNFVSFVHAGALYSIELAGSELRQISGSGSATLSYGVAEFVAQEEMKRMTGYWWSPDEASIAFTRVDTSGVDLDARTDVYADRTELVQQRYPFTGSANAEVDLGLYDRSGDDVRWLGLPERHREGYLARVNWLPDSSQVSYQWQTRNQQQLTLYLQPRSTKDATAVLTETSTSWINLHHDLVFLDDSRHFIWASERSGFKHLYLYRTDGSLIRQLTSGDWQVDSISAVDDTTGFIYFTGRKSSPLERHLYRASMTTASPGQPVQLSQRKGMHTVTFAGDQRSYIDSFSSSTQPPQVSLHGPTGERVAWLHQNIIDEKHPLSSYLANWSYPEFGQLRSSDNQTLYYQLTKPTHMVDNQTYPVIVMVYGGPRAQRVTNSWGDYFSQYLAQRGFVVFKLDNRGSGNRGKAFEQVIYRNLAQAEVQDQVIGAEFLQSLPYVDDDRIGVFGHSYGGYMALHLILRHPQHFQAAVAGAPVTDWRLYDTHYTERYMGTPQDNPEGYRAADVLTYAEQLEQPLLIYHGMADDNVLYTHTAKLSYALQQAMLPFELMAYPGKQHGLRGRETSIHRYRLIADFFARQLQ